MRLLIVCLLVACPIFQYASVAPDSMNPMPSGTSNGNPGCCAMAARRESDPVVESLSGLLMREQMQPALRANAGASRVTSQKTIQRTRVISSSKPVDPPHAVSAASSGQYNASAALKISTDADIKFRRRKSPPRPGSRCRMKSCENKARFGPLLGGQPEYCTKHKKPEHLNLIDNMCMFAEGCTKRPSYGSHVDRVPLFCVEHKKPEHIDVRNRLCKYVFGCKKRPAFGILGDSPQFCRQHKQPWHEDVISRRCSDPSCNRRASFGNATLGIPLFCKVHQVNGTINVRYRTTKENRAFRFRKISGNGTKTSAVSVLGKNQRGRQKPPKDEITNE